MSDTSPADGPAVVLVCRDLFFGSRITGTAKMLGLAIETTPSGDEAARLLKATSCRCVVVDLETPGLDLSALLSDVSAEDRPTFIAFGPHVRSELLAAARQAGCDEVLPRSRFSSSLSEILGRFVE